MSLGPNQRGQAAARVSALPLPRDRWNEAMGGTRDHRRQPHQHGTLAGLTASIRGSVRSSPSWDERSETRCFRLEESPLVQRISFSGSAILHRKVATSTFCSPLSAGSTVRSCRLFGSLRPQSSPSPFFGVFTTLSCEEATSARLA